MAVLMIIWHYFAQPVINETLIIGIKILTYCIHAVFLQRIYDCNL